MLKCVFRSVISGATLGERIQSFTVLSVEEKLRSDLPEYTASLFSHANTSHFLRDVIDLTVQHSMKPVALPIESQTHLQQFLTAALSAKNMNDCDIATHFLWNNGGHNTFPFTKASSM